jgi:hypothetical protein
VEAFRHRFLQVNHKEDKAMTHVEATELFATAKNKEAGKPLDGRKTRLHKRGDDYAIRYHDTDVVTICADGTYLLDTGGYNTVTTRSRMNDYTPSMVCTREQIIYARGVPFEQKITLDSSGRAINQADATDYIALNKRLDKLITVYVKGFAQDAVDSGLELPGNGDCWGCLMTTDSGNTVGFRGNPVMGIDHLFGHFDEKYYVPSLFYRALLIGRDSKGASLVYQILQARPDKRWIMRELRKYFRSHRNALLDHLKRS